jgi:hypothetical protein
VDPEQLKTFTERMRSQLLEAEQLERRFVSGEIVTDPATRSHLKLEVGLLRQYLALADSEDAAGA